METEQLIFSILRQREGGGIDPKVVSLLQKPWALLIFLHKLIGNMVFLRFIAPIIDRVLLPLDQVNSFLSYVG